MDLPSSLIDRILVKLPIRDAVRTSILSRSWHDSWTKISCLDFDRCRDLSAQEDSRPLIHVINNIFPRPSGTTIDLLHEDSRRLIDVIGNILRRHSDTPIDLFHCCVQYSNEIDEWIKLLSKRSIQDLVLKIYPKPIGWGCSYTLPFSLFTCITLTRLELTLCNFILPEDQVPDNCFPKLKVLRLSEVGFSSDGVAERLIAGAPILEELNLKNPMQTRPSGILGLTIRAPRLRDVRISGTFKWMSFVHAPHAARVRLFLMPYYSLAGSGGQMQNPGLEENLGRLTAVERLHLGRSLKFFAAGDIPRKLSSFYGSLKKIKLFLNFDDSKQVVAILCILRSSPNLEKLCIVSDPAEFSNDDALDELDALDFWQEEENLDCVLSHLRIVKFCLIHEKEAEKKFMKFVLANSPVLDEMVITSWEVSFLRELRQSQKASTEVRITQRYQENMF